MGAIAGRVDREPASGALFGESFDTFFYVDPPYRCSGGKGYAYSLSDEDHRRLAEALHRAQGKWLLSYNSDSFIRNY